MNPIRYAVQRPYTVAVAGILLVLASLLAWRRIPVQLKPTVETPQISVRTLYPGAGPEDVEEQVTRRIEDLLQGADGLRKLSSSSMEGISTVVLEYQWGVDKDRAMVDVINRLSQLPELPREAEAPVVSLTGEQGEENSMWILARSHYSPERVRQLVVEEVEPRLERIPGVARLLVVGGAEREIRVLVDPERLAARDLAFADLGTALRLGFLDLRGGTVESGMRQLVLRTEGRSPRVADIAEILVRRDARGTVRVGDVAQVEDGWKELTSLVRSGGRRAVVIGVGRETGANVVEMIAGVDAELERLNSHFRERGVDLVLVPVYRDTTYLRRAMAFVQSNLLLGAGLAILVLVLFLRSARSVLVVGVSIPVSLLAVFLVLDALGRTLNVVSLAGLAFAAGMVVDNAIVVLENVFRHLERGAGAREAAEEGGREVWGGVLAATLTTVAVFLPIVGIQEEAGQLFGDIALAIAAAVAVSLVVALLGVPTAAALLYRRGGARRRRMAEGPVLRRYGAFLGWLLRPGGGGAVARLGLVVLVAGVALLSLRLVPPAGYLPAGNRNLVLFLGNPIPGMRPEALEESLLPLEDWILAQPETERYFLVVSSLFNGGGVILKPATATGPGLRAFLGRFLPVCFSVPGFRSLIPIQASLFRDSGKQFTVEIRGPDLKVLEASAGRLQRALPAVAGVQPRIRSDHVSGQPELRVVVDPHRAAEAGLTVEAVGRIVETAVAGRRVGTFSDGGRDYDLTLLVPPERVRSSADLASLPVATPASGLLTLGDLARVERSSGPRSINRRERERAITLTVSLEPDAVLQAVLDQARSRVIAPELARLPADYDISLGGSADKFGRTLAALTGSFWLAILISYLLLVALFRSWITPLVILVTVPLALTGGLLGITLAERASPNATFDLLSMLGFVILAGIVVNNAILIIHQANNLRDAGQPRREALWDAARTRLRPILMSVTTTVCGMLPLALGSGAGAELYQGLAAVVVGGLLVSTVFTLAVVPALLALGWDLAGLFGRAPA